MKRLYIVSLLVIALAGTSCMKDLLNKGNGGKKDDTTIPSDFGWKTTHDVTLSAAIPTVDGKTPEYALVRVYLSPVIREEGVVAKGVLSAADPLFRTALTIPASLSEIYVKITLPSGLAAVKSVAVTGSELHLDKVAFGTPSPMRLAARPAVRKATSMPTDYPKAQLKTAADFDASVVIASTPTTQYDLGADYVKWNDNQVAAAEYYIPQGAEITGNISLSGGQAPYKEPILYVAGQLNVSSLSIGSASLVVLPGGQVNVVGAVAAQNKSQQPAIYVFEGGKFSAGSANLSCTYVVNEGEFTLEELLDLNGQLSFYNLTAGKVVADEIAYSNKGGFFNDGAITTESFSMNTSTKFENCENGVIDFGDCVLESGNTIEQKGAATIDEMTVRGNFFVYCYTYIDEMIVDGGSLHVAPDACLDIDDAEFNNAQVELAAGSLLIAREYNTDKQGHGNKFRNSAKGVAVVRFEQEAVCAQGAQTDFMGPIEVVYDSSMLEQEYQIDDKYVKNHFKGAYLTNKQVVNIPASECNGGKGSITPEPENKPSGDVDSQGRIFTYCFEDGWPWTGDYDMNDIVILASIDRTTTIDGSQVKSIRINWEVKASGAMNRIAAAVQLDKVPAAAVAAVESTHKSFGEGPFAAFGLEAGHDQAVVALFNSIGETQPDGQTFFNTYVDAPAAASQRNQTTITFTTPVNAEDVLESALNMFIVVNQPKGLISRGMEIHLPTYKPTIMATTSGFNTVLESDPYKFFMPKGDSNNGMVWGLVIPDLFRYPSERNDIRTTYQYFKEWAVSGGTVHEEWYNEQAKADMLY